MPAHASAARTSVSTPVRIVGSWIGANFGEWLYGTSSARRLSANAFSQWSGSWPPTNQNTDGQPAAVANAPKSSLPSACGP